MLKVQTQEGVRNKLLVRTDEQSSFYFLLISSLRPNVCLHCYLYGVFFHTPSMKKKYGLLTKYCFSNWRKCVRDKKTEIQNMKHGGRGHDQRNRWKRKCAAAVLGWVQVNKNEQKTTCRCETSLRWRDVRGRKKRQRACPSAFFLSSLSLIPLTSFSFPCGLSLR